MQLQIQMIHSYFPQTIRSNTSLMRQTAVMHITQIQVMDSRWVVDMIFICMTIAMQTPHHTLTFQVLMVKIKVAITSLQLEVIIFKQTKLKFMKLFTSNESRIRCLCMLSQHAIIEKILLFDQLNRIRASIIFLSLFSIDLPLFK